MPGPSAEEVESGDKENLSDVVSLKSASASWVRELEVCLTTLSFSS